MTALLYEHVIGRARQLYPHWCHHTVSDVLHTWGYQTTRRHARERLVGAQRYAAASTKLNGPRRALESCIPFSEQLIESGIENGATHLQQRIGAIRRPANRLSPSQRVNQTVGGDFSLQVASARLENLANRS